MLDAATIVQRFLATKMQVHPEVVRYLSEKDDPGLIDQIIASVPGDTIVVSLQHIPGLHQDRDGARFLADPSCEVLRGAAGTTKSISHITDYCHYFRDRYQRLGEYIRPRAAPMPIEALKKGARYRQEACSIMGLVMESKATTNGHRIVEIEDSSASISVLFHKERPQFGEAETLVPDEVVAVRGTLSGDGRLFFAEQLFRPDIPLTHAPFRSQDPGSAILISDVHVGSNTFLDEAWNRFADWLSGSDASYLLIAGDLVDGIGVYPNQEQELTITNIYEQYEVFGSMLRDLPSRMKIVICPGNHDVVRAAEPQPAIPSEFTANFPSNCIMVENPALVSLQGVRVQMYHGRSIDDFISLIPGASYENAAPMMMGMLQRRHLAPTYGKRTPIAAGKEDALIIDPIPEVLHTGHVHIMGIGDYRGVLCVNSGTWQGQTAFQKQMNITPTPGRAVVLDLQTLNTRVLDFT
ncbi:MAG TPA: DNA-directed DNA polymerase II small subunit [Methanolinea sp.]|jgi:DNA polymerase II small subunit|nr:MAG: DNA polymerase II small subunit [Methanoregulaceae archaeon PtaB.Bin009]OPY41282.1 MAG: DNA polymerase II small subunit [Methanoregulaceae archaeon PtaU1.Bin066]HII76007.1 DNA-directed DNA polymerase II small subunit [Methanolinea sp.]HNQ28543.1 DNA-directed DNA polymerase II small subunit [Methanolinea sp.]